MRRPGRGQRGTGGEPLPPVFPSLHQAGIQLRRGQVAMFFAEPNSGKSLLGLYWVARLAQKYGTRVLYLSADTDQHDVEVRLGCMLTEHSYGSVDQSRNSGLGWDYYAGEMSSKTRTLAFTYDTNPGYDYIQDEVLAYNEMWGDYPEVIVVDNLGNVASGHDNEWAGLKEVTKYLKLLGRETGACVLTLHHANEKDSGDPSLPPRRSSLTGKVSQFPELVVALSMDDSKAMMRVAAVKNRSGAKDARGSSWIELYLDPNTMQIFQSEYDRRERNSI